MMSVSESDLADLFSGPSMVHRDHLVVCASCSCIGIEIKLITLSSLFLHVFSNNEFEINLQLFLRD